MNRLQRIASMTWRERFCKISAKADHFLSPSRNLRRLGFYLDKYSLVGNEGFYEERPEYGPSNLSVKLQRHASGGPFEPLDITLVNKVAARLAGEPTKVLEVGSGTGMFSSYLVQRTKDTIIVASEFDDATRQWARENRSHPRITFCKRKLSEFVSYEFDLCVALEVVEHIDDYASFLSGIARVAPRAIVSTPNKFRSPFDSARNAPEFDQHVREWSAGEFYWVLKVFWEKVSLHTIPHLAKQVGFLSANAAYEPISKETGVHCREHCLIAVCDKPRFSLPE